MNYKEALTKLGDLRERVIVAGGASVDIFCQHFNYPFTRRASDLDLFAENNINSQLLTRWLTTNSDDPRSHVTSSSVKHFNIGGLKVDQLDSRTFLFEPIAITLEDRPIRIVDPAEAAGIKLYRAAHLNSFSPRNFHRHDVLDISIFASAHARPEGVTISEEQATQFVPKVTIIFMLRSYAEGLDMKQMFEVLDKISTNKSELAEKLKTDDPASALYGFKDKGRQSCATVFCNLAASVKNELEKSQYQQIYSVLDDDSRSIYDKQQQIKDILKGSTPDVIPDPIKFSQAIFEHPHMETTLAQRMA